MHYNYITFSFQAILQSLCERNRQYLIISIKNWSAWFKCSLMRCTSQQAIKYLWRFSTLFYRYKILLPIQEVTKPYVFQQSCRMWGSEPLAKLVNNGSGWQGEVMELIVSSIVPICIIFVIKQCTIRGKLLLHFSKIL